MHGGTNIQVQRALGSGDPCVFDARAVWQRLCVRILGNEAELSRTATLRGSFSMAWLTVQEAAELLRVPVSWLYERTRTNSVPHVKLGKYLRFDRDELAAWVDELKRDGRGPGAMRRSPRQTGRVHQR